MEDNLVNALSLVDIIKLNNISVDFLKSSLGNEEYHNFEFDYDNLFWKFNYSFDNFFSLLQKSESELLELRVIDKLTIDKLTKFFLEHNCHIGMFTNFTITSLYAIQNEKFKIEDLTPEERTLSLVFIQCLVKTFSNDMELGKEIRNIFTHLK